MDLTGKKWSGHCDRSGRRQAIRIGRGRIIIRTGEASREIALCLPSPDADGASPDELPGLVRTHREIGNRAHHVRDFTCDGDRCRAAAGNLPRNRAALRHAAISIVRMEGRFPYLPPANRHYAARPREAVDAVLRPG